MKTDPLNWGCYNLTEQRKSLSWPYRITIAVVVLAIVAFVAWCPVFPRMMNLEDRDGKVLANPASDPRTVRSAEEVADSEGEKPWLSIWLHADWQERRDELKLMTEFDNDPRLKEIVASTRFAVYTDEHAKYKTEEFSKAFPVLPCVIMQSAEGGVLYKRSGDDIPSFTSSLVHDLRKGLAQVEGRRRRFNDCPDGECYPTPPPSKVEPEKPTPEISPAPAPQKKTVDWPIGAAVFLLMASVGVVVAMFVTQKD